MKSEIGSYNNSIFDNLLSALDYGRDINWNMYEACEHFESASRYYSMYDYTTGDSEVDKANEKIASHDNNVLKYNEKMSLFWKDVDKLISK
jgi:hypothetical protein